MRFCGIILFLLINSFLLAEPTGSQNYLRARSNLSSNSHIVPRNIVPELHPGKTIVQLETPFAQAQFTDPSIADQLKGKVIEKIQLVYTTFKESPSFDQQKLNLQRLTNLYNLFPDAFSSALVEWELVGQSGATSPETGKTFFHGFVFYIRETPSTESMLSELKYIEELFDPKGGKPILTHADSLKMVSGSGTISLKDGSTMEIDKNIPNDSLWRYVRPSSDGYSVTAARWASLAHDSIIVQERSIVSGYVVWRSWKLDDHYAEPTMTGSFKLDAANPDTAVVAAFRKGDWKNAIIVTDVTGSMSPYTAQVMYMIPQLIDQKQIRGCIFFNDGDGRKSSTKNIGNTGGIYSTTSTSLDSIMYEAKDAMKHGDGGDLPENDLEAVLYAINKMGATGDIILIADNLATPRDLELIEKIGRPVHIILCGARGGVNPDYLYLARATHGSIHTTTVDLYDLDKLQDGNVITIGRQSFMLHGETFLNIDHWDANR